MFRVDGAGIQRVLRAARAAGLLRATDYGHPSVTDGRVTTIELDAGGVDRRVHVESLLSASSEGLTTRQQAARRALRAFERAVTRRSFYDNTRRVDVRSGGDAGARVLGGPRRAA